MTEQPRDPETGQFISEDEAEEPAATEEELNGDQEGESETDEAAGDDEAEEAVEEADQAEEEEE